VVRYLVKWKGYPVEESTWERADTLRLHAQDSIDEYERMQAELRGEETVGLHYLHTLQAESGPDAGGSLTLNTVLVDQKGKTDIPSAPPTTLRASSGPAKRESTSTLPANGRGTAIGQPTPSVHQQRTYLQALLGVTVSERTGPTHLQSGLRHV